MVAGHLTCPNQQKSKPPKDGIRRAHLDLMLHSSCHHINPKHCPRYRANSLPSEKAYFTVFYGLPLWMQRTRRSIFDAVMAQHAAYLQWPPFGNLNDINNI